MGPILNASIFWLLPVLMIQTTIGSFAKRISQTDIYQQVDNEVNEKRRQNLNHEKQVQVPGVKDGKYFFREMDLNNK